MVFTALSHKHKKKFLAAHSKTSEAFPLLARPRLFFPTGLKSWLVFIIFPRLSGTAIPLSGSNWTLSQCAIDLFDSRLIENYFSHTQRHLYPRYLSSTLAYAIIISVKLHYRMYSLLYCLYIRLISTRFSTFCRLCTLPFLVIIDKSTA